MPMNILSGNHLLALLSMHLQWSKMRFIIFEIRTDVMVEAPDSAEPFYHVFNIMRKAEQYTQLNEVMRQLCP